MKITPIAQGSSAPNLDSVAPHSPERLAAAKAIAAGQEPVSSGDAQVDRAQASIRKIKMKTQVSTDRVEPVQEIIEEGSIPAISEPLEGEVVEEIKPLSPQFAALAKTKRALQVKERELALREEALKTSSPAGNEDLLAQLKADPLSVLQGAGVTYDQLTEAILNNQSGMNPELQSLKSELNQLKQDLDQKLTSRDKQAEEQVLNEFKREINSLTASGDEYEAIREAKAQQTVVDLIHRVWQKSGEVMDLREAAELVENQLIDEALPFARIKKVQSRLTPQQAAEQLVTAPPKPGTKVMRTLTNRDSARPVSDRRARAIAAMQGTLKRG